MKPVAVSLIIIVLLSATSGVLFYSISHLQTQNSNLQNQLGQLADQTGELMNQLDIQEKRNSELQNRIKDQTRNLGTQSRTNVQITEFIVNDTVINHQKGTAQSMAYVTVHNFGIDAAEGLRVVLDDAYLVTSNGLSEFGTLELGTINPGETRTVSSRVLYFYDKGIFATLMAGNMTLDERSITAY